MVFDERATNRAARDVLRALDEGGYSGAGGSWVDIRDRQEMAEKGTRLYTPDMLEALRTQPAEGTEGPIVEISDATTAQAAQSLARAGQVALLNFASARNPGGGFLGGARAQEEELCRCSGLYRTLVTQPAYYEANRQESSLLYTDHLIFSPSVPFFRISTEREWLAKPFMASVITTPAPNAGAIRRNRPSESLQIEATFRRRWSNVLAVARDQGQRVLVLGAWGCGAFRNDPVVAARTAEQAINAPNFGGSFDRIVFAIPSFGTQSAWNLLAFQRVFEH